MQDVVAADRTAIGVFQDSLADFSAALDLLAAQVRDLSRMQSELISRLSAMVATAPTLPEDPQ